jgi:hypothetical protein
VAASDDFKEEEKPQTKTVTKKKIQNSPQSLHNFYAAQTVNNG